MRICIKCNLPKEENEFVSGENCCKDCKLKQYREKTYGEGASRYYDLKFLEQCGYCAICGKPECLFERKLGLDHDHNTGKWRGLLCSSCNTKLGWFEKNKKEILEYLNKYSFTSK